MVGELIAGRYELEELVGTGGMSSIFRARDRQLDRLVALKILHERFSSDPEYVERFRREARAAARLGHPNIVTVIDRGESGGRQFIVFEYVDGENLKELVERCGPLPVRRALELTIQIGDALAFAHGHGLVHRDVKPQNVLLPHGGGAKVADFGLARAVDPNALTLTGTVLGTGDYISPEQASGRRVDARSDVYSLGAVLYELVTGEVPYSGPTVVAVALRHVQDPVPSTRAHRPDVPLRVDAAIRRALAKDADERFPSMEAFVAELEACLAELDDAGGERTIVLSPPRGSRPSPEPRRRRAPSAVIAAAVAAAVVVGALAVVFLHRGGGGGSPEPATAGSVRLEAVAAYDPEGDGREHDERLSYATDGNPATYWETESYRSQDFGNLKHGVGLVVDAGRPVRPADLKLKTDTPGFRAEIEAGAGPAGPFRSVSPQETVEGQTTFSLAVPSPQRYYLIWITRLPPGEPRAHVNVVSG